MDNDYTDEDFAQSDCAPNFREGADVSDFISDVNVRLVKLAWGIPNRHAASLPPRPEASGYGPRFLDHAGRRRRSIAISFSIVIFQS